MDTYLPLTPAFSDFERAVAPATTGSAALGAVWVAGLAWATPPIAMVASNSPDIIDFFIVHLLLDEKIPSTIRKAVERKGVDGQLLSAVVNSLKAVPIASVRPLWMNLKCLSRNRKRFGKVL
jgi:hypothetical protein